MATSDDSPRKALVAALVAMLGVAVVVGLAVAGVVLGLVRVTGMGSADPAEEAPATLGVPEPASGSESPDVPATRSASPTKPAPKLTLEAEPETVAAGGRIDLTGTYRGGDGVRLQVQRRDGGQWADFPVTADVSGGSFATWVQTSRTGKSEFRVLDRASGEASAPAVVTVR